MLLFQDIMRDVTSPLICVLLLVLAWIMFVRKLHRDLPVFFSYLLVDVIATAIPFVLILSLPNSYTSWYSLWIGDAISIVLQFAILFEIFRKLFAPYEYIRKFATLAMFWSTAFLIVAGVLTAAYFHEVAFTSKILTVLLVSDRSVRIVQLGVVLSLFALTKYLHLRWKSLVFGITLGFGFNALMLLAFEVVRMYYGRPVAGLINGVVNVPYCAAIVIWLVYVLQKDVVNIPVMSLPSPDLERWNEILSQILRRTAVSS